MILYHGRFCKITLKLTHFATCGVPLIDKYTVNEILSYLRPVFVDPCTEFVSSHKHNRLEMRSGPVLSQIFVIRKMVVMMGVMIGS